jgi:two-component system CheB/CheR fusion protein
VCGIGASAGGVEALQLFFTSVPDDLGLAYVVVVHLAPDHKSELPAIIARWTTMPVVQVADHDAAKLVPNQVYVIAPDRKLEITDTSVGASKFEQPRGQRAAIDLFFRSLAQAHGDGFAVILSGTGADGTQGAKEVKGGGGLVLVQDPNEAAHGDMPRAVIATGVADVVLPVRELTARLAEFARDKARLKPLIRAAEDVEQIPDSEEKALRGVLELLRKRTGHDFAKYKRTTVVRRLSRRMQLAHQLTISDYWQFLRTHLPEADALFNDLLISVTAFFRDAETWAALQEQVIGPLVDQMQGEEQIRVWVPGCATGEEAYTVAILFHEAFERRSLRSNLIIFASDVDEAGVSIAREGLYSRSIGTDVSESRLERYFRVEDDHYRVVSELRDCIVFAAHSLLRDPPFSRLHLISCRNLLIYLDRELQEQVMAVFRYACRDKAYLVLGASENAAEELFEPLDKKHRIYASRPRTDGVRPPLPDLLATPSDRAVRWARDGRPASKTSPIEIHLAALDAVAPPSLVVDERWNVLHLSPSASRFLQQSGGPPARRVTEFVRPELRDELHVLLHRAAEAPGAHVSSFIPVAFDGATHRVVLVVQARDQSENGRRDTLITLLDLGGATRETPASDQEPTSELVRSLREQLRHAEQRIDSVREDHFLTNEDLRAANEELQSLNEEYRSTTEELETSKEELQSINEELQTVNNELKVKLEEISRAHDDLENLMAATDVATLFLNPELRIKRFTPQLSDLFNIKARDYDRPIADLTHVLDYRTLEEDARTVLATMAPIERTATSEVGRAYIVRLSPYRTAGGETSDGVVVTFVDVTAIKKVERALRASEQQLAAELNIMRGLHVMTMAVATASTLGDALSNVLTSAISLLGADCGRVQLFDRDSRHPRATMQQGFSSEECDYVEQIDAGETSPWAIALRTRTSNEVSDVLNDPGSASMRDLVARAGYRAVQCTPLCSQEGDLVGMVSVYFRAPHRFSEREKQLADLVGQQAADLVVRNAQQDTLTKLNDELRERTEALEASQEELLHQDSHREEFLASLGHELRNPMSAILSSLSLLRTAEGPDERSNKALAVLRRQTAHMTKLIDDLLDITRVKHGKIRLDRQTVALDEWLPQVLEGVRPQVEKKGLTLVADLPADPIRVHADPQRLAQILENLLRNAVTYTQAGSITVAVRANATEALIAVTDTGVGIDPKDAAGLFSPYRQGNDATGTGGLGLGLAVVKTLVEAHGGSIAFQSGGRGSGSEFSFSIPLSSSKPATTSDEEPLRLPSHRIVVVDDQPDVADSLAAQLEELGQDVQVAYSAEEGLAQVRRHDPQLAFVDLSMPETTGAELARQIRKESSADRVMLVAMTGHGTAYAAARTKSFDRSLLKPITTEKLIEVLGGLRLAGEDS